MKKPNSLFLILLSICCFTFFSKAQLIVDGVNLNEREDIHIIRICMIGNKVSVDFGQNFQQPEIRRKSLIKDKNGDEIYLYSLIEASNYLLNNVWQLMEIVVRDGGDSGGAIYHYFKKKK